MGAAIKMSIRIFILLVLSCMAELANSQNRILSRRITFDLPKCNVEVALGEISRAGKFSFSYDADLCSQKPPGKLEGKQYNYFVIAERVVRKGD